MEDDEIAEVMILMDLRRMPPDVMDILEHAICPNPEEPGHEDTCPLLTMSVRPFVAGLEICSHCQTPMRGSAFLNNDPLCHPDEGLDCYRLVTVHKHPMPCEACRSRHGGDQTPPFRG